MTRIEVRATLDEHVLADVCGLLDEVTAIEGHQPVGEHKYAHLTRGARDWTGVLAYDDDRLVGYAHVRWNAEGDHPRAAVEVVVRPDHPRCETLARGLLDETRSLLARTGGGLLFLWVHRVEDPYATLAARAGFRVQRQLALMTRELEQRPEVPAPPEGVRLRAYRPGEDDAELLRVNNAAFADHPEQGGWQLDTLAERRRRDWFDPAGLVVAWRDERMVGFHWTKRHAHDAEGTVHEPVGEVYVLAVSPEEQGTGLGRLLLSAGLAHLHDRGCRRALLYVDADDAGPVRLYESAGFTTAYKEVCYEDRVGPAAAAHDDLLRPA